jgi:ubiquinone/menaquinone biosynthesis C-methylase UbiE
MSQSFAKWYDFFMSPLEKKKFKQIRSELLAKATGTVLEIGAGTGINFPLYEHADKVTAIEPSEHMIARSQSKHSQSRVAIEVVTASAEALPFADHSFDSVVATLVFCTIPNPEKALEEIKRVCRPGGKILFFEHVKMENPFLGTLQEWLTPGWKKICDGCCLNRDTLGLIESHGLPIVKVKNYYKGLFIVVEAVNHED